MVSLYLCSSGSNARGESRAREGRRVSSKSPSRVRDGDEEVAGRNGREYCSPNEGSLICPPGKSMIFHKKETEKNELVTRPEASQNLLLPHRRRRPPATTRRTKCLWPLTDLKESSKLSQVWISVLYIESQTFFLSDGLSHDTLPPRDHPFSTGQGKRA